MPSDQIPIRWPPGLRDEVRALVGPRGLSAFVIDAVREKIQRDAAAQAREAMQPVEVSIPSSWRARAPRLADDGPPVRPRGVTVPGVETKQPCPHKRIIDLRCKDCGKPVRAM